MAVNTAAAYGIYSSDIALTDIVRNLNQAGFENESICMMLPPGHPIASIVRDASLFNSEKETGAVTAGLIGWLLEFGAVLIPTVGFFIRSQAFFHALMVAREAPHSVGMPERWWASVFRRKKRKGSRIGSALLESSCTSPARRARKHSGPEKCYGTQERRRLLRWKKIVPQPQPDQPARITAPRWKSLRLLDPPSVAGLIVCADIPRSAVRVLPY